MIVEWTYIGHWRSEIKNVRNLRNAPRQDSLGGTSLERWFVDVCALVVIFVDEDAENVQLPPNVDVFEPNCKWTNFWQAKDTTTQ